MDTDFATQFSYPSSPPSSRHPAGHECRRRHLSRPAAGALAGFVLLSFGALAAASVQEPNSPATGRPAISGTALVGETLTASLGDIDDADGLTGATYRYQWYRASRYHWQGSPIRNATSNTYTLRSQDEGAYVRVEVSFTDDAGHGESLLSDAYPQPPVRIRAPLTAEFRPLPIRERPEGKLRYMVELDLSHSIWIPYAEMRDHGFTVTNGTVVAAKRLRWRRAWVDGRYRRVSDLWRIAVEPTGYGSTAVSLSLPGGRACDAEGALCTLGGRTLSNSPSIELGTPELLSLSVADATATESDRSFTFAVSLSRPALRGVWVDYETTADGTAAAGTDFSATRGRLRFRPGDTTKSIHVRLFNDTIEDGETVVVRLTGAAMVLGRQEGDRDRDVPIGDATATGTMVWSSPGLSVADATAREGEDMTVDFVVRLSRAASEAVTVNYATSDGTATAGSDYTATSGTLTFGVGETSKTVSVPLLDDTIDENAETFTLTLSSPSGARLADATATGTIQNDDPMPRAWLARFGRTVASQAVDTIGDRLAGAGGTHVTLAGRPLSLAGSPAAEPEDSAESAADAPARTGEDARTLTMTGRELLRGSSFRLRAGGESAAPAWTAWGRFAASGLDAEQDGMRIDASVASGFLGADVGRERWLAGVALGFSDAKGDYARMEPDSGGEVASTLVAIYPYARFSLNGRFDLWGLAGIGAGDLKMTHGHGSGARQSYRTDISMRMGAVGARGELYAPEAADGFGVAVRSHAFWVRTSSEAVEGRAGGHGNLAAAQADVTRLRLAMEGSRSFQVGAGKLTPSLELGLRHDGGDAETGIGVELGAGLRYAGNGVSVDGSLRRLVAHESAGYREWGVAGAVRISQDERGRGLSLTVAPGWGAASSRADGLRSAADPRGLASWDGVERGWRLDAELAYGLPPRFAPGVVTPYAGLELGEGSRSAWRTGARSQLAPAASLSLEAANDSGGAGSRVMLQGGFRW